MARQASLMVADEIYYNLQGKAILQGLYHADLTIPSEPAFAPQLIFYFMAETDVDEPFKVLHAEVTLPGNQPVRNFVNVIPPELFKSVPPGRTRAYYRHPLLVTGPILRSGKIEAKLIHEKGELIVGAPWIVLNQPTPAVAPS
jgi:hypothetical protein